MAIALGTYKSSYYITPSQVTLMANDQNNPSLVYVGVRVGTYVEIHYTDRTGATPEQVIGYGPNSSYQKWQLSGSSTKLASNAKHYIYIRLRRTEKTAMLIFSTRLYDFYGENPDGVNHAANRNLYYYILAGELTATDGTSYRELTFQTGNLSTPENSYDKEEADSKFLSFEIADQRYLNQVEDDTAKGVITFLQGIKIASWEGENTSHSFQLLYDETLDSVVLSRTDGKPAHFLATGALSTRALGNIEEEGTGGGMDYVYNVDDFSKALDTFNKVSETDTFNAYAIRSLYEMVKNIENSSTDTSYVDDKIEEVNEKIDTKYNYLSEWIEKAEDRLQLNIDAVESTLQENIDTVAGDLSTLQNTVNDFLTGTDTDTIINRWKELESFLNGYTETSTLAELLSGKADKATTLAGYGITNAYTKTEVDNKITSVNTSVTTLQTTVSGHTTSINSLQNTVSGHTTSINSLQNTVSGHTSSITSINSKITTLQGYFTNGVANFASRLSDGAEYKAWGQVFFKDGKPVNVSGEGTFTQVNADSVLLKGKARLSYDSNLNALLLTRDDGTAVHFLASGAVATKGLGEIEEGGGGTGTGVDLLNVPSDIRPSVGGTYDLGSSANAWKMIYANGGIIGNTYIDSARVIFGTYIQGQSWTINPDGSASLGSITSNGEPVATRNWVNSQSFAKTSDLTSINNNISSLQASTFTGANAPEGKGYTLTWFTQSGGGRNVTIPAYGEITDGLAGIGQNVALVDQWLIADLISYVDDAVTGGRIDLTSVASDIIPDGNLTRKLGSSDNRWSLLYVNSISAGTIVPRTDNAWDIGASNSRWRRIYAVNGYFDNLTINNETAATQAWVTTQIDTLAKGGTINNATLTGDVTGNGWSIEGGVANFGEVNTDSLYINGEGVLTSSSLANYVTLNTEQTISGKKTFTGGITVQDGITASYLYSVEYLDSSALTINAEEVNFTYGGDDSNILVGLINGYKPLTLGNTSFSPSLTSGTVIGTINIGGESKTIYAPNGGSADLSNYVTLDGEQTITGGKYFSDLNANSIYLQGFELKPHSLDGGIPDRLMYDTGVLLDEYNYGEYLDDAYIKKSGNAAIVGGLSVGDTTSISTIANTEINLYGKTRIGLLETMTDNFPFERMLSVFGQSNMYGIVCGGEFGNYGDDMGADYANWWIMPDGVGFFQSVENLSDVTKKSVIGNVQLSISDIAAAPSIYFTWTEARRNKKARYVGTTAQYWNDLLPELVSDNNGVLSLDYATLGVTLGINIAREVNTMKMWQASSTNRIDELEERVKALEAENKALRELLSNK